MYYNDDHQILRLWVARRLNSNWSQAGGLSIIVASPNINKYQKESNLYQKSSFKSSLSITVASSRQDQTLTGIRNTHLDFDIYSPKSRDRIGHY